MIIEHSGKRIAFGLNWKPRLSEGDIHGDARAAKSRYFWYADNAVFFGTLPEGKDKKHRKSPLYAGAVALIRQFPDVPNLAMVLAVPQGHPECPDGGFIICGIHQSRPRSGYDKVLKTKDEVTDILTTFKALCGPSGFVLYGDVSISGITAVTLDDVLKRADQTAPMRKTKSAIVNPLATGLATIVVIGALSFGYNVYTQHKRAEAHRIAMAAQKDAQQLYDEELASLRAGTTVLASSASSLLVPLREMAFALGGWPLKRSDCTIAAARQMVCVFDYVRAEQSKATYETFVAAANQQFTNIEFAGKAIKATKSFSGVPFVEYGPVLDAAKPQRAEVIEFDSTLQRLERLGKQKRGEFEAFGLPPGVSVGELTSPPATVASWEFTTPLRNVKEIDLFPGYATISHVVVTHTDQPAYELDSSLVMVTVTGKIHAKPN